MSKNLNVYLSNLGVLYIKLHNLHWNVTGHAFKQVHEYIETLYDDVAEKLDEIAELQKMQDVYPLASLADYIKNATIKEVKSKDIKAHEAIDVILKDVESMKTLAMKIRTEASKSDNFHLSNMMEDHVATYDKDMWFMRTMLKKD